MFLLYYRLVFCGSLVSSEIIFFMEANSGKAFLSQHQILSLARSVEQLLSTGVSVDDPGVHCLLRLLKAQDLSFLQTSLPALSHNINGPLSSEQRQTLKTEISAYRNLSRNIPLTPEVYRHLAPAQANMSSNLPPSIGKYTFTVI